MADSWRSRAACRDAPPGTMHPTRGSAATTVIEAYCNRCGVKGECLEFAIELGERVGVYGGTSGRERIKLINQRKAEEEAE